MLTVALIAPLCSSSFVFPLRAATLTTRRVQIALSEVGEKTKRATDVDVSPAAKDIKAMQNAPNANVAAGKFTRAAEPFGTGVTAAEVVNVLGRWQQMQEWNSVGVLGEMDQLFSETGVVVDGPALQRAWERWDAVFVAGLKPEKVQRVLKVKGLPEYRAANLPVWRVHGIPTPHPLPLTSSVTCLASAHHLRGARSNATLAGSNAPLSTEVCAAAAAAGARACRRRVWTSARGSVAAACLS